MNYTLHVLKGRSEVGALRLVDGVNSVGRHDDCVIRIRSSQVSRRHCEIFEADGLLMVRDLGSSNGTYVNGQRVLGQQPLKPGDVIGVGGISLRVDPASSQATAAVAAAPLAAVAPEIDTAELEAVEISDAEPDDFEVSADAADDDEGFEVSLPDDDGFEMSAPDDDGFDLNEFADAIPLADDPGPAPKAGKPAKKPSLPQDETVDLESQGEPAEEDDAVAQFLMDLKLDEED